MAGGSKSKNKGASGERELCRILSDAFGGSFIRSNNSGAYIGGKNVHRKDSLSQGQTMNLKGDIVPPDNMPKFVIESKWYKEFPYHTLLSGRVALLDEWIDQTIKVVDDDDFWIVAFKANRRPWCVLFPSSLQSNFNMRNYSIYHKIDTGVLYIVTDLLLFLELNKEIIMKLAGNGVSGIQDY